MLIEQPLILPGPEAPAAAWLDLRSALWPETPVAEHCQEIEDIQHGTSGNVAFIAYSAARDVIGFAEVSVRRDYVNGCETSPVGFLEGIYVLPEHRRRGIARRLTEVAERWVQAQGCTELASDSELSNAAGRALHAGLGFAETEQVVFFRKQLTATDERRRT